MRHIENDKEYRKVLKQLTNYVGELRAMMRNNEWDHTKLVDMRCEMEDMLIGIEDYHGTKNNEALGARE